MKRKLIAILSAVTMGISLCSAVVNTASAVTLAEPKKLEDYTKSYSALSEVGRTVTFSENQALISLPLRVQKNGCVIDSDKMNWDITGTADVTYKNDNLMNSVSYDENYAMAYCLITANTPGTVYVKATEISPYGGYIGPTLYINLNVDKNGKFDETVSSDDPDKETNPKPTDPTEYVIYESEGWVTIDSKPDKTSYTIGEELDLTGLKVGLEYGYGKDGLDVIYRNTSPFDYPDVFSVDTSEFDSTKAGTYNIYVDCIGEYELDHYRVCGNHVSVPVTVSENIQKTLPGDADGDGEFHLNDLIVLKKWLTGSGKLSNWKNADLFEDGKINVFDFCMMKRELLKIYPADDKILATDLTIGMKSQSVTGAEADEEFILGQTEFALNLFKNTVSDEKNTFISPYSVMQALAMTANGADKNTKAEMEKALGGISIEKLNEYLYTQRTSQPNNEKCKLNTANSIWYRDDAERITVLPEFLQTNADYYDASAYSAPFDDSTVKDINTWVNQKTDKMIPQLLDEIPNNIVMYLINAVVFDAKWESPYSKYDVSSQNFTAADGSIQKADMMMSLDYRYIEDENATGLYKYYKGRRYAFAALLPKEGMSVTEYINTLTPESLYNTLSDIKNVSVETGIPKFSYDYDIKLNDTLKKMGMPEAFTQAADFSKMAQTRTGLLYISEVLHKTHIEVAEEGTKAAAVTSVAMTDECCPMIEKSVILNRPFVYCIVDTQTNLPVFIGAVTSIEK